MTMAEAGDIHAEHDSMADARRELLARIMRFDFDAGRTKGAFAEELARENGWESGFAARVVEEYRKFAFLAQLGQGEVLPSDEIDQAWRLHLASSRNYWEDWCAETLARAWHRTPANAPGDAGAHARYETTLSLYRREFGEAPPIDIWPPAAIRFAFAGRFTRVNLALFELRPRHASLARAWPLKTPLVLALLALAYAAFAAFNFQSFAGNPMARTIDALVVAVFQTALTALAISLAIVILPRIFDLLRRALGAEPMNKPLFEQRQHGRRVVFGPADAKALAIPMSVPPEPEAAAVDEPELQTMEAQATEAVDGPARDTQPAFEVADATARGDGEMAPESLRETAG